MFVNNFEITWVTDAITHVWQQTPFQEIGLTQDVVLVADYVYAADFSMKSRGKGHE